MELGLITTSIADSIYGKLGLSESKINCMHLDCLSKFFFFKVKDNS